MVWSIHYLRGIAALLVVVYHLRGYLNNIYAQKNLGELLFNYGYFGVDLFFMISGFVIVSSTQFKSSRLSFVTKRFFRIYPLYIVSLVIFIIISKSEISTIDILKSIAFIHLNYSDSAPFFGYSVNYPSWTLTYEILFYFIFFVSLCISHKYRFLICSTLITLSFLSINYFFGNSSFSAYSSIDSKEIYSPILKILSSPMMIEFIVGMSLFYIFYYLKNSSFIFNNKTISIYNSILFVFSIILIVSPISYGHGLLKVGLGCFLLLLTMLIYELSGKLKKINFLCFFGDISYSLYISHVITIKTLTSNVYFFSYINQLSGFSKLLALLASTILFAYILHKAIEVPFVRIGKNLLNKN